MTPHGGNAEQNRLILRLCFRERGIVPFAPVDFVRAVGARGKVKGGHWNSRKANMPNLPRMPNQTFDRLAHLADL